MTRAPIAFALAAMLAGCGTDIGGVQMMPAPKTPDQALYEAEVNFDLALKQAVLYAQQPRCGAPAAPKVCSTAAVAAVLYQDAVRGNAAVAAAKTTLAAYHQIVAPNASDADKANAAAAALVAITAQVLADIPMQGVAP